MKNLLLLSLTICLFISNAYSQAPGIEWAKCYGGSENDSANCIVQTKDGGYIVAGKTRSNDGLVSGNHGKYDAWIVKLKSNGVIEWQKTYGGTNDDDATSIIQTNDGGYIVAGSTSSNDGNVTMNYGKTDYWIIKLKSNGSIEWQKSYGGSDNDYTRSIIQTKDSGYIVAGFTYSQDSDVTGFHGNEDYWVVKLKRNGIIEWQQAYGGTGGDRGYDIIQTYDGGYIVAGVSHSKNGDVKGNHGDEDAWILKLKSNGIIEWQKCYGGSSPDDAYSIIQTSDSGYIFTGATFSNDGDVSGNHGSCDYWVVKLTRNGSIDWQKTYGSSNYDEPNSIFQTNEGGYIVAGVSISDSDVTGNYGGYDFLIVKIKSNGILEWQKNYGGSNYDYAYSIIQATDSGYVLAGYTNSNDSDVSGNHGKYDFWIVKLKGKPTSTDQPSKESQFSLYPNPCTNVLKIPCLPAGRQSQNIEEATATIMDISGRVVSIINLSAKESEIQVSELPPGFYLLKLQTMYYIYVQKFVKE